MENKTFYNEVLTDHNLHPGHKHALDDANMILEGVNPSCGDDIFLNLKFEDGVIKDGSFQGDGCAISQASADMMLDLIVGKTKEEALQLADIFLRMIKGEASDDEIDQLEDHLVHQVHRRLEYLLRRCRHVFISNQVLHFAVIAVLPG